MGQRGSLSFPLLKFMSVFFLVEKKDEKRREKRNLHVLPTLFLPLPLLSPLSLSLWLSISSFFLGMKRSIDSIDRGRERASWLAHLFLRLDKNIIWREGGLWPSFRSILCARGNTERSDVTCIQN